MKDSCILTRINELLIASQVGEILIKTANIITEVRMSLDNILMNLALRFSYTN